MKYWIKRWVPESVLDYYHRFLARFAARWFRHPSEKLIIIGVTGTKGKTTTANLIWHLLTQAGHIVGIATTANFRIGNREWLNATKMTMLGRLQLQRLLQQMVDAHCRYAVIETSSEGIKQWRHLGINYDVVVLTNLYPEHLDAHGGFENYKNTKLSLLTHLTSSAPKSLSGSRIQKVAVLNGDSEFFNEFMHAAVPVTIVWSQKNKAGATISIADVHSERDGLSFRIGEHQFISKLRGEWNIESIASAIGVALSQDMGYPQIAEALASFSSPPGRMEQIRCGQPFTVIVDYAYEPVSLRLLYSYWRRQIAAEKRLITLISSTGGGRDVSRREGNGRVAGELCDEVIVTDEDPFDDDPQMIIDQVAGGVAAAGKVEGQTFWRISDRRAAITEAFRRARPGDFVFLTCKGADQKICRAHGKKEPWDDRTVAKDVLKQLGYASSLDCV